MFKEDLALNNLQELICHEIKPNLQTYEIDFQITFKFKNSS